MPCELPHSCSFRTMAVFSFPSFHNPYSLLSISSKPGPFHTISSSPQTTLHGGVATIILSTQTRELRRSETLRHQLNVIQLRSSRAQTQSRTRGLKCCPQHLTISLAVYHQPFLSPAAPLFLTYSTVGRSFH